MTQIAQRAAQISEATEIPLIVDGGPACVGPLALARSVKLYERSGAAALRFEVGMLNEYGAPAEALVIAPLSLMADRIKAAADARRDRRLLLIARCDSRSQESISQVEDRLAAYVPEINSVADLRGKVLGVITKGASSDHASIAMLRQYNMTQHDMKVLYLSRQEDALAALNQGLVSAAVHSAPTTLMAGRLGFKELVNIGALKLPYPFMGLAIRRSTLQPNSELTRGFLKVFLAGLRVAIEQPELSKPAVAKYLATKDQEIVEEAYKGFAPLFPKIPYVTDEAIRSALSVTDHPKATSADPKMFYDNRFLRELETSGFVKELYAGK